MKRMTVLILGLILILSSIIFIHANDIKAQYVRSFRSLALANCYYIWRIDRIIPDYTITYGTYEFFYEGSPAGSIGEVDTITATRSVSNSYSGSIAFGLKKNIELSLGYSFTDTKALSSSKQSRILNKGEYVRGYWRPIYSQSKVIQGQYHHLDGYTTPTGVTMTCYGKRAAGICLKLEYYSSAGFKVNTEYFRFTNLLFKPFHSFLKYRYS
jgi:hypothetical protein